MMMDNPYRQQTDPYGMILMWTFVVVLVLTLVLSFAVHLQRGKNREECVKKNSAIDCLKLFP